jgi:hypothetical protein
MTLLALALLSILPRESVVRESVCLIEVNHFYNENADKVFDQVIFYEWDLGRYQVVAWRLVKSPNQLPQRDWQNGGYVTTWQDGEIMRQVRSPAIRETWTQSDPELLEREVLPKSHRRELRSDNNWHSLVRYVRHGAKSEYIRGELQWQNN